MRLLETEFPYVSVDAEDGLKRARERAAWIERAPSHIFLGHHEHALETAKRLKALPLGDALTIEFGDDKEHALRIVLVPGELVAFGFRSNEEESEARSVVERCARVLESDVVVI